jgi:hypothetical protein
LLPEQQSFVAFWIVTPQHALPSLQHGAPVRQHSCAAAQQAWPWSQHFSPLAQQSGMAGAVQQALSLPQQAIGFVQQPVVLLPSAQLRPPKVRPATSVMTPNSFVNMRILQEKSN